MEEKSRVEIEKLLSCPVCFKRLNPPVTCCSNGHFICNDCRQQISSCPQCRRSFINVTQTCLHNIIEIFPFSCQYADEGCDKIATPKEIELHEPECNFRPVRCVLLSNGTLCQKEMPLPVYTQHIEDFHNSYVHYFFDLNQKFKIVLPKKVDLDERNCHYRIFSYFNDYHFMEMIYYDDVRKMYQISIHLIGNEEEAKNFMYTIGVKNDVIGHHIFSNNCLPNLLAPHDVRLYYPFLLVDQNDLLSEIGTTFEYNLKIQNLKDYYDSLKNFEKIDVLDVEFDLFN